MATSLFRFPSISLLLCCATVSLGQQPFYSAPRFAIPYDLPIASETVPPRGAPTYYFHTTQAVNGQAMPERVARMDTHRLDAATDYNRANSASSNAGATMESGSSVGDRASNETQLTHTEADVTETEKVMSNSSLMDSSQTVTPECCQTPRIWASAEYIHWWSKGMNVPALVTTSVPGTTQDQAARLGQATTSTLFGGDQVLDGSHSGARFGLGGWFNMCDLVGLDLTFLILENESSGFSVDAPSEILGRPFFNVQNGEPDAKLIDFPNLVTGAINAAIQTEFYTGEALLRKAARRTGTTQVDWYVGYRVAGLEDEIRLTEDSIVLSGPVANTAFELNDQFRTRNMFHGVDLGLRVDRLWTPCLSVEFLGKVALGRRRTETDIFGTTTTTVGGATSTFEGGLLAQPTNHGSYVDEEYSSITELGLLLRRPIQHGLNATLGYTMFYWHDVVRAGSQIDPRINPSQFPPGNLNGEPNPSVTNRNTDFWTHGLRVGLEYIF